MEDGPPEPQTVRATLVACDGGDGPLGHPVIYLTFRPDDREIVCPYCSRRFRLADDVKPGGTVEH